MYFFSLFLLIFLGIAQLFASLPVQVQGKAVVLINARTGKILFEHEKDLLLYPASTTKLGTALFVLEKYEDRLSENAIGTKEALATILSQVKRESNYRSPPYWLENDGKHMSIKNGEVLPLKELLYALLINSPNDAANVIASHLGEGSITKFMGAVNLYFKEIGLTKTYFVNPHGLHHPLHVTTAEEMALLACHALKYPLFRDIISRTSYKFSQTNLEYERVLAQTNGMIKRGNYYYPYAIGGKTGTTKAAGKCLVVAAEKGDRLLVASLFGYTKKEELYGDATKLFEAAFSEKKMRQLLLAEGTYPFKTEIRGAKRSLSILLSKPLYYDFYPSEREHVYVQLKMDDLQLPVPKGEKIGELLIKNRQGELIGSEPILTVKKIRAGIFTSIKQCVKWKKSSVVVGIMALCIIFGVRLYRKSL